MTFLLCRLALMLQNDLEQVLRQIGDKDQKIQNLEALLQKSKDIVSQLEAEREDLCAKIQAGEGETALLSQLKEKNHALQEQVGTHKHAHTHCPSLLYKYNVTKDTCLTHTKKCAVMYNNVSKLLVILELVTFLYVGCKGNTVDRQDEEPIGEQQASPG